MHKDTEYFNIKDTLECGQCFRWNENEDGSYVGVADGKIITVKQTKEGIIYDCDEELFNHYFDLSTDYKKISDSLLTDDVMKRAISLGKGIRILNQDFFETVISFIISQNNNIPRIKGIIEKLCKKFGKRIDGDFYAFPKPCDLAHLTPEDLAFLKAGYRDKYIIDASLKILNGEIDFEIVKNAPIGEARKEIMKIKGVGPKVADCILLFSAKRAEAFPTDVWIKKVLTHYYNVENITTKKAEAFSKEKFGEYAGYAQQYLFYLAREEGIWITHLKKMHIIIIGTVFGGVLYAGCSNRLCRRNTFGRYSYEPVFRKWWQIIKKGTVIQSPLI